MQGIRNLIHRRRPSAPIGPEMPLDSVKPLTEPDATDRTPDARQIAVARAGRSRVPGPEDARPEPFRQTMGQDAPEPQTTRPPSKPQIWDIDPPKAAPATQPETPPEQAEPDRSEILAKCAEDPLSPALRDKAPAPAQNRAKTRLLGFHGDTAQPDVFAAKPAAGNAAALRFPIGWIVVLEGPGRGASFTLTAGLSTVGRDAGQTVALDFGDTAISREGHVAIAFDEEENQAFIGHGGKSNIVRLNDKPLLTTETLKNGDTIRIGKTVLRFVGLCSEAFSWADDAGAGDG